VKLKGFQKLTLTDKALQSWLSALQIGKPKVAVVSLQDASGRVLAEDVIAQEDLPRFDKSAVDGYAIKSADSVGASQFKPATFQLTENPEVNDKQAQQVCETGSLESTCARRQRFQKRRRHQKRRNRS
jgi:molybdopterin molybdotransferase